MTACTVPLGLGGLACGAPLTRRQPQAADPESAAIPAAPRAAAPLAVAVQGAPAAAFSTSTGSRPQDALERSLLERLPGSGVDPCLERAARAYAQVEPGLAAELPMAFVEHVLHWAGCPDPSARLFTAACPDDERSAFVDWIGRTLDDGEATAVGAAEVAAPSPMRWRRVAFVVTRKLELRPVPASAPPGSSLPLQLRIDPSYGSARVYVIQPRGRIRDYPVGRSGSWAVAAIPIGEEIGRQWVEVMADAARGPEVLALFPIEVGREPPRLWVGEPRVDESTIGGPDEAEELLARLAGKERARFELPALERDPRLDAVARGFSEELAARGELAHVSPTSGAVHDRLAAAGYRFRFAAENLAESTSLVDAHEGFLRSPGHRAAMLSPEATRLGLGVARRQEADGGARWFIAQLFVLPWSSPPAPITAPARSAARGQGS